MSLSLDLFVNNYKLPILNSILLGVFLASDLSISSHITATFIKFFSTLKLLYSNRYNLDQNIKISLRDSLIKFKISEFRDFGNVVYALNMVSEEGRSCLSCLQAVNVAVHD